MVMGLTTLLAKVAPALGSVGNYTGMGKEVLSDGGTTITWTIPTDSGEDGGIDFP